MFPSDWRVGPLQAQWIPAVANSPHPLVRFRSCSQLLRFPDREDPRPPYPAAPMWMFHEGEPADKHRHGSQRWLPISGRTHFSAFRLDRGHLGRSANQNRDLNSFWSVWASPRLNCGWPIPSGVEAIVYKNLKLHIYLETKLVKANWYNKLVEINKNMVQDSIFFVMP
jgi:hypothetical protein